MFITPTKQHPKNQESQARSQAMSDSNGVIDPSAEYVASREWEKMMQEMLEIESGMPRSVLDWLDEINSLVDQGQEPTEAEKQRIEGRWHAFFKNHSRSRQIRL